MRSTTARIARRRKLRIAAATLTAVAGLSLTACSGSDTDAASGAKASSVSSSSTSSVSPSPSSGNGSTADGGSASGGAQASNAKAGSGEGSTAEEAANGGGDKSGYGQSCGTNDVSFTLTWESQAGGYYLVTAKAKSGITCYLDVNTPSVSFGSGADGVASPVGQGGEDPIKLSGSTVAYTGISPKTTGTDGGTEFESVIVALTEDDSNPAELTLPEPAVVDKPIVTNWSTNSAETVPLIP
ncbi:hypothetical protein OKJ48_00090 [Streptomyces kunmingensis]|uniref:DUF4232 domain-containing protein n=1 Tax=Streptomyces kunmingensis TaxID=68225 RepID=A0ABU6C2B1_9ACTN|nr:hypothetical protein [Streptomyces kunmingensis]MEB3958669.1 hypothetical protein [Streptomyces kunmingensis]